MKTKKCSKCGEIKGVDGFSRDKSRKDGLCNRCKDCTRKYREKNRERIKDCCRKYREKNRDVLDEYARKYHKWNREVRNEYNRKYRKENREVLGEYSRKHYKENIEWYMEYGRKRSEMLTKSYVAELAKIPASQLSDENYEILKLSILTKRALKEIKNG